SRSDMRARRARDLAELDEQRQGHGRHLAGPGAAVVHARLWHRQRDLLSARRHPADPRSRLYRRRAGWVLVGGDAERELHAAAAGPRQGDAFGRASAGYVGTSDGWQDFYRNGAMSWEYGVAGPGNVALTGELPRRVVLALGFGSSAEAAATLAISSLIQPFDN